MSKILLIDDGRSDRKKMRALLLSQGHEVTEARDGKEGILLLKANVFDCIIIEIIMPFIDGIETICEIRKIDHKIKIIAVSDGGVSKNLTLLEVASELGASIAIEKRNFQGALDFLASFGATGEY